MKIKDFFSKFKSPKKSGNLAHSANSVDQSAQSGAATYHIQLTNLEDQPLFELSKSLTIGSEVGEVVLDDPSLSPRHCTITLEKDVISVIDHASSQGTFIGEHQIPANKVVILKEGDFIRAGEIEIDIIKHQVQLSVNEVIETTQELDNSESTTNVQALAKEDTTSEIDLKLSDEAESSVTDDLSLESSSEASLELDDIASPEPEPEPEPALVSEADKTQDIDPELLKKVNEQSKKEESKLPKFKLEAPKAKSIKVKSISLYNNANALVRLLAFLIDLVLVGSLVIVMLPFDWLNEYSVMTNDFIHEQFIELLLPHVNELLKPYEVYTSTMLKYLAKLVPFFKYLYLFLVFRLATTLIFGVSLGQFLMGISAEGRFILKRLLGMLREFFAILFLPFFMLLDFPVLIEKRSFKEVISFTRLSFNHKWRFWVGLILFLPLSCLLFLISPIFKGFEYRPPMLYSVQKVETEVNQEITNQVRSIYLSLKLTDSLANQLLIPRFELIQTESSRLLIPVIDLHLDEQTKFSFNLQKSFSMGSFLARMAKYDLMFADHYPTLSQVISQHVSKNEKAKMRMQGGDFALFQEELKNYLKRSLSLDLFELHQHVLSFGPFLMGYVDARDSLINLFDLNEVSQLEFIEMGQNHYLAIIDKVKKAFYLLPLINDQALSYQISLPKNKPFSESFEQFKTQLLPNIEIISAKMREESELSLPYDAISLIDVPFIDKKDSEFTYKQYLMEIYYHLVKLALKIREGNVLTSEAYIRVVQTHSDMLDQLSKKSENEQLKQDINLVQKKLNELIFALESNDESFFSKALIK